MCMPDTTKMWDTPSSRKLPMSSSEMPLPSPSTMARRKPASRRGRSLSSARPTWRRIRASSSPGGWLGFSSTTMPWYWERYAPAWKPSARREFKVEYSPPPLSKAVKVTAHSTQSKGWQAKGMVAESRKVKGPTSSSAPPSWPRASTWSR